MDKPCCKGVVRDSAGLKGSDCTVGGAPAYFSGATGTVGVVVIHDIWGFNIPNAKYIADHFAGQGFPSVLPNLYAGISTLDGWAGTEFDDGEALEGEKWDKWWTEITSTAYWVPFLGRIAASIQFLQEKGCSKFCLIGFCWGGIAIERLSTTGVFCQAASVHGCHEDTKNYLAAQAAGCNIVYHTVKGDESFPETVHALLQGVGASVTVYEGMEHGFAVRGDFSKEEQKKAADSCLEAVVAQFSAAAKL